MKTFKIDGSKPNRGLFYTICYHLVVCEQFVEVSNIQDMEDFVSYFKRFLAKAGYPAIEQVNNENMFIYTYNNKTLTLKEALKI